MSAPTYAATTQVPVEKTKAEIDTLLGKHGASQRGVMHDELAGVARVVFTLKDRRYRIDVPLPSLEQCTPYAKGALVTAPPMWGRIDRRAWIARAHEQAVRVRWRGLLLLLKAKLEIVRLGSSTFEREFLADLLLPDGQTASEAIGAYMQKLLAEGYQVPLALPEHRAKPQGDR